MRCHAGYMQAACIDLAVTTSADISVSFWIESACNTSSTRIWMRYPTIPANDHLDIYIYYGDPAVVTSPGVIWSGGQFGFMSTAACPAQTTHLTAVDNFMIRGGLERFTPVGDDWHSHSFGGGATVATCKLFFFKKISDN